MAFSIDSDVTLSSCSTINVFLFTVSCSVILIGWIKLKIINREMCVNNKGTERDDKLSIKSRQTRKIKFILELSSNVAHN